MSMSCHSSTVNSSQDTGVEAGGRVKVVTVGGRAHELQAVHAASGRDVDAVLGAGREHHHAAGRHREAPPVAESLPVACMRDVKPLQGQMETLNLNHHHAHPLVLAHKLLQHSA